MTSHLTTVEVINDLHVFADLRQEWTRLLDSRRSSCLFLTWEWLHTWWRHLGADRRLHLLLVRSEDKLVALAPFALSPRFRFGHA